MYISVLKNKVTSDKNLILNHISTCAIENKDIIIAYLTTRTYAVYAASAPTYDIVAENYSDKYIRVGFFDGKYEWTSEEIMYFEKYNLKLNKDFIHYILEQHNC